MDAPRIAQLLDPFLRSRANTASSSSARLTPVQLEQISTYIDLLIRWNARINLTAIRTPEEIVTRHFGESLFAANHLLSCPEGATEASPEHSGTSVASRSPNHLADLGSGAGFPGLPMKIWSPATRVTLIESNNKKVAFLREVIRAITLTNIDVYPGRAENFPPASANLLTLRAVERFDAILPTATTLLVPGGRLALLIGQSQVPRARDLAPSLRWSAPIPIPHSESRVLLVAR
jgi:16S rRNA (guanine527-N7)-methyltransferase